MHLFRCEAMVAGTRRQPWGMERKTESRTTGESAEFTKKIRYWGDDKKGIKDASRVP